MKLKNKKTGETAELIEYGTPVEDGRVIFRFKGQTGLFKKAYRSLAEFNEEWEDYEESKKYWYMDYGGRIKAMNDANDEEDVARKQIGNYFEAKEEAEQAVEKLKAWKRLKDSGISFEAKVIDGRWYLGPKVEPKPRTSDEVNDLFKDIMFIFGGEE